MADSYLGFYYNGEELGLDTSDEHEGFIVNSGEDLVFSSAPEFSNEFTTPRLGNNSIYVGNTVSKRIFSFKVNLVNCSMDEYRDFLR